MDYGEYFRCGMVCGGSFFRQGECGCAAGGCGKKWEEMKVFQGVKVRRLGKPKSFPEDIFLPTPGFLQLNLTLIRSVRRKGESAFLFVLTLGMALLNLVSFYIIDGVGRADEHLADWGIVEMDVYVSRKADADERESGLLDALEADGAVDF